MTDPWWRAATARSPPGTTSPCSTSTGSLYVGPDAVPGAPEAVRPRPRAGMRPAFVTNNASRTPEAVAAHLRELGVAGRDRRRGDVRPGRRHAASPTGCRAGRAVLVVGGEGLRRRAARARPAPGARGRPTSVAAVVQGFAPDVGWRLLAEGAYAVATGAAVGRHATWTPPSRRRGHRAGQRRAGRRGRARRRAARRTRSPASPEPPLHQESVRRTGAERPLVVGDRLDTDIEGANRAGVPSLLVLTGVSRPADLLARRAGAAADLPRGRPAVRAAASRTPASRHEGAGWRCGGWTVQVAGAAVDGDRRRDRVDGLRALCVAWWAGAADLQDSDPGPALAAVGCSAGDA